jgi:shikimate dehydrogenase
MDEYFLIGGDVAHSISPCLHAMLLESLGIRARYRAIALQGDELARWMKGPGREAAGMNVTFPHKERILAMLDEIEPIARSIGAVNTVVNASGALVGHNTDWVGAMRALEPHIELRGSSALVIGAGGAARAIVHGLIMRGASVTVANRTPERALALAAELGCAACPLSALPLADILVNATNAGMHPAEGEVPVPAAALANARIVLDIVYTPRRTRLLKEADAAGCITVEGVDMLIHQAIESLFLWTGRRVDPAFAKACALRCLGKEGT